MKPHKNIRKIKTNKQKANNIKKCPKTKLNQSAFCMLSLKIRLYKTLLNTFLFLTCTKYREYWILWFIHTCEYIYIHVYDVHVPCHPHLPQPPPSTSSFSLLKQSNSYFPAISSFFPKKICGTYLSDSDSCCPKSMISSSNHFLANTIIPFFLLLNISPLCLFIPLTSLLCLFTPTFFIHSILYGSLPFPHTLVIANHVLIHS